MARTEVVKLLVDLEDGRRLWFVDVRWQNENAAGAAVATERTRYILWEGDDGALRIRTIIAAAE